MAEGMYSILPGKSALADEIAIVPLISKETKRKSGREKERKYYSLDLTYLYDSAN